MQMFSMPAEALAGSFWQDLPTPLRLGQGEGGHYPFVLMDSFDWRLFRKNLLVVFIAEKGNSRLELRHLKRFDGEPVAVQPMIKIPALLTDIPQGALHQHIAPILEMRALLPIVEGQITTQSSPILDDETKTVVRLRQSTYQTGGTTADTVVTVLPVRGYDAEMAGVTKLFKGAGAAKRKTRVEDLFAGSSQQPLDYSGKMNLQLAADMPAREAAQVIYKRLLAIIRANLDGLRRDIDTEFLHDFRVAVRRTRSGLSQFRGLYDEAATTKAKQAFATLGSWTNLVRDLDVYLLTQNDYLDLMPPEKRADLAWVFKYLARRRQTGFRQLMKRLDSEAFHDILDHWESYVDDETSGQTEVGKAPVMELATARIYKRYRKIRKMSLAIHQDSPDQEIHDLRIECKKLRYLLEFFSSIFPPELVPGLIKRLKHLQTVLGDFNDLYVQYGFLDHIGQTINIPPDRERDVLVSVGLLMGRLFHKQRALKQVCIDRINQFVHEDINQQFKVIKQYAGRRV